MPLNSGMNVTRTINSGLQGTLGGSLRNLETSGATPTMQRAVVVDVIYDPKTLDDNDLTTLASMVTNPELVGIMPANSIVARTISNSEDQGVPSPAIFFPFYSSHLMLPVQPGEQVVVVYEDIAGQGQTLGFWMTRASEWRTIEDVNYTHGDRKFDASMNPNNYTTTDKSLGPDMSQPDFRNGAGTSEGITLSAERANANPYDKIVNNAKAYRLSTPEPVPRWTKRPTEFVIQGCNNSLIMLGEDRVGPATRPLPGEPQVDKVGQAGTIDIVVGRSRRLTDVNVAPSNTQPWVIDNSRNNKETNKAIYKQQQSENTREGDPDPVSDAARIYVSMNTSGDTNFHLLDLNYPTNTLHPTTQVANNSYVILKADHIREIARKAEGIDGTVLIMKEGTAGNDLAYFFIDATGKVQIEGNKIYLSQATGEDEPYIKWSKYDEHINKLKEQIAALADQVNSITNAYKTAFQSSNTIPYSPVASLVAAGPTVQQLTDRVVGHIKTELDTIHPTDAKSSDIFGH